MNPDPLPGSLTGRPGRTNSTGCWCARRRTPARATRSRRHGGRCRWSQVDAAGTTRRSAGQGAARRRVRGTTAAARLLPHVARRQAGGRPMRGLHVLHRARARVVVSAQPRRHLRDLLRGHLRRERALPRLHGVGHAVVLGPRCARRVAGRATDSAATPAICATATGCSRRTGAPVAARRPVRTELSPARPHRVRQAGNLGGIAGRLAAVVRHQGRAVPSQRAADRAVVPAGLSDLS